MQGTGREVTLIEDEALEALFDEAGLELAPGASRRNIVTRGVPLNHLVNREFCVGAVRLRGMRLCEPCLHLEHLTQMTGARRALVHRGGLRAEIVTEGVIRAGDAVHEAPHEADEHDIRVAELHKDEPTVSWEELKAEQDAK